MLIISNKFKILPKNLPIDNLFAKPKRILGVLLSISENTFLPCQIHQPKLSESN
jgi:hypothetical protein